MVQPPPFVVYFEGGRSELSTINREIVNRAVERARAEGCSITLASVDGYTDSLGAAAANDRLSQARAESVKTALIAAGVRESNIRATAHGENNLAMQTGDGVREPLNNRVELLITVGR
jgi:outer membrane protein OmpA-like peptidoglycan-associated protein